MNWFLFARAPAVIRVDSEGAFKSQEFREWCAARGIEVQMAAGEAHWQIGLVETHFRLLKSRLSLVEDELVGHCAAAKVRRQTFDGYSPLQWWFGTPCVREVEEQDLENIDQVLNDDWNFRQLPKQLLFVPTLRRPCVWSITRDHVY